MTRTETLQAIAALPVSDEVKAHARRLIEGLPEWAPMPEAVTSAHESLIVKWSVNGRILVLTVDDTCEQLDSWISFTLLSPTSADIASTMFHYGMVALTGGGLVMDEYRRARLEQGAIEAIQRDIDRELMERFDKEDYPATPPPGPESEE